MEELISVFKMIESVGGALADTITINGDKRSLAQFADAIAQLLGKLERLVISEISRREQEASGISPDHQQGEPAESCDVTKRFGEADYEFRYSGE
jgi:hypothetical protein